MNSSDCALYAEWVLSYSATFSLERKVMSKIQADFYDYKASS